MKSRIARRARPVSAVSAVLLLAAVSVPLISFSCVRARPTVDSVAIASLDIRSAPKDSARIVAKLGKGTHVAESSEGKSGPWARIEAPLRGWALSGLLKPSAIPMAFVQGGTFTMGSKVLTSAESPPHRVSLSSYWIGVTELTRAQFATLAGTEAGAVANGESPAWMSWYEAVAFCNRLSAAEGLEAVYAINGNEVKADWSASGYRLPTEAEWEFACRGGNKSRGYAYSGSDNADEVAWYLVNSDFSPHPVGQKRPNELGLYDMSGNVWEWCWDFFGPYAPGALFDPHGPDSGDRRISRGSSFHSGTIKARPAARSWDIPEGRFYVNDMRLVLPVSLEKQG
jgi:formylglycine-generating enzyme